jgi:hypothetical protein
MNSPPRSPNPRRVAAGKLNRAKRKGLTPAGAERLRRAALAQKPWEHATGPRTPEGKAKAAANGLARAAGRESVRAARRAVAVLDDLFAVMGTARRALPAVADRQQHEEGSGCHR